MCATRSLLPALLALLAGAPAVAQEADARPPTIVTGTVRDPDGRPVVGAEVFLGTATTPATTNAGGVYRITAPRGGAYWVAVRRIGYSPSRRSVTLRSHESHTLDLVMDPLPLHLPEIVVEEQSGFRHRRLADFWRRSRSGWGRFVTRDVIDRQNPLQLSQVVRRFLPFAALGDFDHDSFDPYGDRTSFYFRGARRCAPAISYNGTFPSEGWRVNDFPVHAVEALEIYRPGQSEIPFEFQMSRRAVACGLVVVWIS